jgi:two-component system CheB/CheR fusion protein
MDVKAALLKAMASGKPSVRTNVLHGEGDERRAVTLQVEPLGADDGGPAQLFVVVFQDKPAPVPEALSSGNDAGDAELVRVLELELQSTKERLQTTAEELERSNEDLRISNEELSSVNEELQSSNEELETSKEELQSINEELRSVNAELTTRVEELGRANNDLRNLFASTQIAMLFLDRDLQIMNFTPPAKALFKLRDHDVGRPLDELRLIVQCDDLRDHLVRVIETGEVVERDVETIPGHDRVPHTYMMTVLPYRDEEDRITGGVVTLVDITALRDSERALAAERKFMTDVIESAPIGISIAEAPHGKNPILNREARQMLGFDSFPDDLTRYEGLGAVHPDGRPYAVEEYPTVRVLKSGTEVDREEMIFERDGERRRWIVDSAPVRDAEGKLVAAVTTFLDIEEQRRSEEHRQLLIDELNHRVKNTLAVVQSIANQTFRRADVAREAVEAFETRLTALSTAHNLLTRTSWRHADLRDLVEGLRDAHAGWRARIRQSGQQVRLAPKQAIALSLALHELCTNAMKYGALSVEDGTVEVTWHKTGDAGFELFWTEAGGPSVEPPAREGFGLRMMRMALANDLEGTIDFDFHNTGLVCTVKAPIGMETTP